jgi:L-serine dehydratase
MADESKRDVAIVDPTTVDRRSFLMRHAVIGAAAVMTGSSWTGDARAQQAAKEAAAPRLGAGVSPDLNVAKAGKGPVMILADEFYKVGPGPSSSHTIGPMRITYDFYQRCSKLPADQLAKATGLKVHLFGSLSATGKGHGTERAALAGLLGKEPATVDPLFLDEMRDKPGQSYQVKLGDKSYTLTLADIVYDSPKGDFPHPNTMTCKLMGADGKPVYEQEYYSVGGGFIEWKGYQPPKKNPPKYPYATMKELRQHAEKNNLSIAQVMMANETAISGKSEAEVNAFLDKIMNAMVNTVKVGLTFKDDVLPGPIKLHSKASTVYERAQDDKFAPDKAIALVSAFALAASEENARGHLVITAPTGGSAGVMPAVVYALSEARKVPREKIREGLLAGLGVGYLCKHNATLAAAEGGCQSEIGVASAMSAALICQVLGTTPQVLENAAESALEHHLGMTCDPVAGYVQVPCIERCAFGAVKAWTAALIATNEIASRHRVDLDTTIKTLADTGKDMNAKYKETSEAGLAQNLVLC